MSDNLRSRIFNRASTSPSAFPPTINSTRRLLGYLKPYGGAMTIATVSVLFGSLLGLAFPWFLQDLINTVFESGSYTELTRITILLIFTFLARSVFYYIQGYSLGYVGERIVVDIRTQVYAHLHELSLHFFADQRIGELISRLSSDVTIVRTALTNNVAIFLSQIVTFIGSLVLMLILNWRLTLFILAIAPLVVVSAAIFGKRVRKLSSQVQDQLAGSTALAEEALDNERIVKAFNRESFEIQRYSEQINKTFKSMMHLNRIRSAFAPLITFLAFTSLAGILWFGGREVLEGRLTPGALIAFLVYGINIAASIGSFASLYTQLQEASGASRRLFELLDEKPDIQDISGAISVPRLSGSISIKNVSFTYEVTSKKHPHVLHHINLEICSGEVLALVGPSGAGKSTLFNLIPRFYDPTQGKIEIDGIDLRTVSQISFRSQIGLVPQETQLFSGTIRDNLLYGKLDASEDELLLAVEAANADEFIQRLPQGLDTLVGEKGVKLSGGQRQRIAIARAILRDPAILLLDEATSSLDSESENLVKDALEKLMRSRTTVVIAHRLSTIQHADRIAVLDQGNLVELGNHAELLALEGLYARLYRLQFLEAGINQE